MKYLQLNAEKAVIMEISKGYNIALYGDKFQYVLEDLSTIEIPVSFKPDMVEVTISGNNFDNLKCKEYFDIDLSEFISAVESKGFWWGRNPLGHSAEYYSYIDKPYKWQESESKTFDLKNTVIFKIQ